MELELDVAVVATGSDLGSWGVGTSSSDVVVDDVVRGVGKGDISGAGGGGVGEKAVGKNWLEGVESVEGWRAGRLGKRATWCG